MVTWVLREKTLVMTFPDLAARFSLRQKREYRNAVDVSNL